MVTAMGSNRVPLGPRPRRVAQGGEHDDEEMADVDEEKQAVWGQETLGWLKLGP
jgi:hypothetical protein